MKDLQGNTLINVDKSLIEFSAGALRVEGDGGVIFRFGFAITIILCKFNKKKNFFLISDSVQTPILKSEPGKELKLESPTRSLEVKASQEIFIQSISGKFKRKFYKILVF